MTGTTWRPDVLADFEHATLAVPFRGSTIDAVVVRRAASPVAGGAAVLYVHGFGDYFSAAIGLLQAHEGVEWLLLNGHSTGGLVAALYAHRGPRRSDVDAVFLNSPFLDMNLPAWQEAVLEPVLSAVGRIVPSLKLPGLSSLYGESLHADHRGEWSFDLAWKPLAGFPARAGWFRAIHRAQAEVAGGLSIAQPVLLLHAGRGAHRKEWNADVLSAVIVLDVADMERLAPGLGSRVEVGSVDGGIHDLVLSREPARARTFELLADWLRGARS